MIEYWKPNLEAPAVARVDEIHRSAEYNQALADLYNSAARIILNNHLHNIEANERERLLKALINMRKEIMKIEAAYFVADLEIEEIR